MKHELELLSKVCLLIKTLLYDCTCDCKWHKRFSVNLKTAKMFVSDSVQYIKTQVSLHSLSECSVDSSCAVMSLVVMWPCMFPVYSEFLASKFSQIHSRLCKCTSLGTRKTQPCPCAVPVSSPWVPLSHYFRIDWLISCHIPDSPQWHKHKNNPCFLSLCQ